MAKGFELGFAQNYGAGTSSSRMTQKEKRDQEHYEEMGGYEELDDEQKERAKALAAEMEGKGLDPKKAMRRAKKRIAEDDNIPLAGTATKRVRAKTRELRADAKMKAMDARKAKTEAQSKQAIFEAEQKTDLFDQPSTDLDPKTGLPVVKDRGRTATERKVIANTRQAEADIAKTQADTARVQKEVDTWDEVHDADIEYKQKTSEQNERLNEIRAGELNLKIKDAKNKRKRDKAIIKAQQHYNKSVNDIWDHAKAQEGKKGVVYEDVLNEAIAKITRLKSPVAHSAFGMEKMTASQNKMVDLLKAELKRHKETEQYAQDTAFRTRHEVMDTLLSQSFKYSPEGKAIYDAKSDNAKLEHKHLLYLRHRIGKHSNISMGQILKNPVLLGKVLVHRPNRDDPFWRDAGGMPLLVKSTVTDPDGKTTSSETYQPKLEFDPDASFAGLAELEKELIAMGKLPSGDQSVTTSTHEIPPNPYAAMTEDQKAIAMALGEGVSQPRPVKTGETTMTKDRATPWLTNDPAWGARTSWSAAEGVTDILSLDDRELDSYMATKQGLSTMKPSDRRFIEQAEQEDRRRGKDGGGMMKVPARRSREEAAADKLAGEKAASDKLKKDAEDAKAKKDAEELKKTKELMKRKEPTSKLLDTARARLDRLKLANFKKGGGQDTPAIKSAEKAVRELQKKLDGIK